MDTELLKGTLSLLILSLLHRKPMYGYEISATVHHETEETFVFKEGSLYPSLHKLEAEGFIQGQWEEDASGRGEGVVFKSGNADVLPRGTGSPTGRKRRYYHLTDQGRAALAAKMESWKELCWAVNSILEKNHGQA